jgi:LPPG:FO 2-phospho-L-lactate transferase
MKLTALAGGTGAAKLLRGLCAVIDPRDLTVIVNTGDDAEIWGLHISPDLDTVSYTLGGVIDERKGWGLGGETFHALDQIARFGEPTWFNLGDRDLATHLHRTRLLREGRTLTFQEYFVREKAQVEARAVDYAGAPTSAPAPGVLAAIGAADAVVVCPSNPITSVGPILAVPGLVEALRATSAPVVAVSPIVGGAAVSGPAGRLMASAGLPVSATGVARAYATWLDRLVFDEQDRALAGEIQALGVAPVPAPTMMSSRDAEITLARHVLRAAA